MNRVAILVLVALLSILVVACQVPIISAPSDLSGSTPPLSSWGGVLTPEPESTVSGDVQVVGSATIDSFQKYELYFKPELHEDDSYIYFDGGTVPVTNGVLGVWATGGLAPGRYTLMLRVVKDTGEYAEFYVPSVSVE